MRLLTNTPVLSLKTTYNVSESLFHSYVPVPSGSDVDEQVRITVSPLITYFLTSFVAPIVGVATKES